MIHNLSHLEGSSVNEYIPQELATVQYASIQNANLFIKDAKVIVFMAKVDIESAFWIILIAHKDLNGGINPTWISCCRWDVRVHVLYLRHSAQL